MRRNKTPVKTGKLQNGVNHKNTIGRKEKEKEAKKALNFSSEGSQDKRK